MRGTGRLVLAVLCALPIGATAPWAQTFYPSLFGPGVENSYVEAIVGNIVLEDDDELGTHSLQQGKFAIRNNQGEPLSAGDGNSYVTAYHMVPDDWFTSDSYVWWIDQYLTIAVATPVEATAASAVTSRQDPAGWAYYIFGNDYSGYNQYMTEVDGVETVHQEVEYGDEGIWVTQELTPYRDKIRVRWTIENRSGTDAKQIALRFRHRPAPLGMTQTPVYVEGQGWVEKESDFDGTVLGYENVPDYWVSYSDDGSRATGWQAVDDNRSADMTTMAGYPVMNNAPRLQRVQFVGTQLSSPHYLWDEYLTGAGDLTNGDMAVHYFWDAQTIAPGEAQVWDLYLGNEWSTSDPSAPLFVSNAAQPSLELEEDETTGVWSWGLDEDGAFTVGGAITNRWDSDMRNGTLAIELGDGLSLAPGESWSKSVPTLGPGESGEVTWRVVPDAEDPKAGSLSWTIHASAAAAGGVHSRSVTRSIQVPALPYTQTADAPSAPVDDDELPGWQYLMMSVPFGLRDPDPVEGLLYTDSNGAVVTPSVWRYNPSDNAWDAYPNGTAGTIQPGYGYFIRVPGKTLISVPLDGTASYQNSLLEATVPLLGRGTGTGSYTGFNQIGNPYSYPVTLGELKFVNGGRTYTYDESWKAGWLPGVAWQWNPSDNNGRGGYELIYGREASMSPWCAYWLLSYTDMDLIIEPPIIRGATAPTGTLEFLPPDEDGGDDEEAAVSTRACTAKAEGSNTADDWMLQLTAECERAADTSNFIGMAPSGASARSVPEPPPVGSFVQVAFVRPDAYTGTGLYAHDVRACSTEQTYTMNVQTNITNTQMRVAWPSIHALPRDLSLVLEDVQTGQKLFMRTEDSYSYTTGDAQESRQFKIHVSTRATGLKITSLQTEALARGGASIVYMLSANAEVDITVLNAAGRVVRTIASAETAVAGRNTATWDGRSDTGASAPSGRYTVRLQARSPEGGRVSQVSSLSLD